MISGGYNTAIVKVQRRFDDEIQLGSGLKLYQDTTYRPEHHTRIYGELVGLPATIKNMPGYWDLKIGDRVYFNYMVTLDDQYELEGYHILDLNLAMARVRDGELKPLGVYVIIKPIIETTEKIGSIFLPQQSQKKSLNRGIIIASNELPTGTEVLFNKIGKFENVIEGQQVYCAMNNNIQLIINGQKNTRHKRSKKISGCATKSI